MNKHLRDERDMCYQVGSYRRYIRHCTDPAFWLFQVIVCCLSETKDCCCKTLMDTKVCESRWAEAVIQEVRPCENCICTLKGTQDERIQWICKIKKKM